MLELETLEKSVNIAEHLSKEELHKIAHKVISGYEIDEASRADWQDRVDKSMDIAKQTLEVKNTPWPNASNVKYPLITQAAIDFASRTYPELIQNKRVVQAQVIGDDPDFQKDARGNRVSKHMSYQLLNDDSDWEEGLDKLLHSITIIGTMFRKTYFDPIKNKPCSELCDPDYVVVNYSTPSLEAARRVTHILRFHTNDIMERMRSGLYLDIDLDMIKTSEQIDLADDDCFVELLEQHCYLDLDDDGYQEPYIVIVHKETNQVLRIVNRFEKIHFTNDSHKKIKRIDAKNYFTDFHFIRSPDGGFYSIGLGTLLYPLNSAINTIINQLVDAGTLNNRQGGFIGKSLRLNSGAMSLNLGEWKVIETSAGTNIAQNVFPLPTKEPSPTLFTLLELLIGVGKDLIAANDVMQGKGQTQNVSPSTVLAMIQQGTKVFSAIQKRLYKSLTKEFKKLFELNRQHLTNAEYRRILDDKEADVKIDYNGRDYDICPVADPNMASMTERLVKAQALMQVPGVKPVEAAKYYLETLQFDKAQIEKLLPSAEELAQQPPPPDAMKAMAEAEKAKAEAQARLIDAQLASEKHLIEIEKMKIDKQNSDTQAEEAAMRMLKMRSDMMVNESKIMITNSKANHEASIKELTAAHDQLNKEAELELKEKELQLRAGEAILKANTESEKAKKDGKD